MEQTVQEFFHDFRQELLAGAEANCNYQLAEFMEAVAGELVETGFIEGFDFCHFRARRGMRADGYWFNDEDALDLFVADFDCRSDLASLTRTELEAAFKRAVNFFEASLNRRLYEELEITSPEYGLSRQIADRNGFLRQVNFFLLSERMLSDRIQTVEGNEVSGIPACYHIWDISRLQRQQSSRGRKEPLDLDLHEIFGTGLPCLPAHLRAEVYKSYLVVIPGEILSGLYDRFGARLLEQNVRCFLQARGKVNQGIRSTILNEPHMFFAYNNGITATAQEVETGTSEAGLQIMRIKDLQIVNGGQTTASLFHTQRKDRVPLQDIFVQMKLAVIDSENRETVVPRISEYANTQNRVNAADFFTNHPFHIRMEEFSRRIWAPAQQGEQRETKWFYERARGQYADAQTKLTPVEQRRFKAENPKPRMFTKTDLAKFENVWDDHPKWVNLGAQKSFARYAERIGKEWAKSSEGFNEFYYRRAIACALIFRKAERLVSAQPWYNGGYRANIVAYAIAAVSEICRRHGKALDFLKVWNAQSPSQALVDVLAASARFVNHAIMNPPPGISNISEWCKKDACWTGIQDRLAELESALPCGFRDSLVSVEQQKTEEKSARKTQKIDDGIKAQSLVLAIAPEEWARLLAEGSGRDLFSPGEAGILEVAKRIPARIPSEKQSAILLDLLERCRAEGIVPTGNGHPGAGKLRGG
ncbi:MAG: AIPR family protein [Methylococcales bacterium]